MRLIRHALGAIFLVVTLGGCSSGPKDADALFQCPNTWMGSAFRGITFTLSIATGGQKATSSRVWLKT